ncbi:protein kinase domain-containing protein [Chamaesiphon sp. VAR_48_metabat_135_sub]|uniref:protein kinase domain-containing protein n=1 Tax=Chamaesiphon sp. VAR_48_metabat_135_sub TaxID=2964699 RepID=UPI00286C86CD|nr:ankyrin repeat domain-containing protein [Chamaesiphon sp. VAR_48_metabat_135_sub]
MEFGLIPTELVIAHPESERETHYQIVGILGEGGSSKTYQAQIVGTETSVALKQLSLKQMDDWKSIDLFEREAKTLSQLNHPGIPKYIDYFTILFQRGYANDTPIDRHFYIVQALAPGRTLSDWSESGVRHTEAEIADIASQILAVLSYLQNLTPPVIHRDIKPSNILRTADGQISLVDFGAVRQAYHDTFLHGSTVVGTFGYMAPEQFRAQAMPATDLYGLGATILNLLTHRSPAEFTQSNLKLSFRDKIQVSPAFTDWLERMLEPDPIDRFNSATTALTALKNPKSLAPKLPWRKLAAVGVAAAISLGTLDYYKYYFLNLWGFTPMAAFTAIWNEHDVNKVKSLLDRGVNPNAKDTNGSSLIHYAVTNNQVDIAKLLIDRGADIHAHYGKDGHTVLHLAVLHQDGEMTKLLLDRKSDPNARDNFKFTPLHLAVLRKITPYQPSIESYYGLGGKSTDEAQISLKSIQYLLGNGADVNAMSDRESPLSQSYLKGKLGYPIAGWIFGTPLNSISLKDFGDRAIAYRIKTARKILVDAGGKELVCNGNGQNCYIQSLVKSKSTTCIRNTKKCKTTFRDPY